MSAFCQPLAGPGAWEVRKVYQTESNLYNPREISRPHRSTTDASALTLSAYRTGRKRTPTTPPPPITAPQRGPRANRGLGSIIGFSTSVLS
ncbi:hypothetical protein AAFF_G00412630 [Aldrovandia affinis]|uniref:Uncharacterized protein n=1 Tax=Aldrovandia affinis TaxID=143900 RepID=A0AAD7WJR2_9TELE|nr:hypothetical protein AAFF_G00412630 [Aldrovandia affinis]